jgi:acyl-CoA synthetase (AMP-forming)/AMP-acid ligase II
MNIAWLLERSAHVHGSRPALAFGNEVDASYAEFYDRAARLACALREGHGLQPGDRVGLYAANHRHYLVAMYSAWIAGAVVVPMNAKLHAREAAWILGNGEVRMCWTDDATVTVLREAMPGGLELLALDDALTLASTTVLPVEPRERDELAWLFYTSGTTGKPKGVMLSHENLLQATQCFLADVHAVPPGEALLHAAPMSHGSGLYNFAYVAQGGLNVVPTSRGFDEHEVLDLANTYPGACLFAAPTMVKRMVDAERVRPGRGRHLGTVVYGGGPMYLVDIQAAIETFGPRFAQIYGQGESPMTITVLTQSMIADRNQPRYLERLNSVGHAQLCVELSIRDTAGHALPPGSVGEICARGPAVMQGYWKNPEATREALRDGWLWTGDIGVLDDEGFLTLKDRSKDLIISGGTNIYPREVEEALLEHPRVREVSVIGMRDDEWGESVCAFVVGDNLEPAELDAFCLERLARFKRPRLYQFVAALPKNNYGKVLKSQLREMVADSARVIPKTGAKEPAELCKRRCQVR